MEIKSPEVKTIKNNEVVETSSLYDIGDVIKFSWGKEAEDKRISYSKITHVIPKLSDEEYVGLHDNEWVIKMYYSTENNKFIPESDIIELVAKYEQ